MTERGWILRAAIGTVLVVAVLAPGCSNKGKYAGKVNVEVSKQLADKGVSLEDWRYSESQKTFGVKLKASKPLDKQTYLVVRGPGIQAGSPIPMGDVINEGKWIDFGGSVAFGNPFDPFPESGTITIDLR